MRRKLGTIIGICGICGALAIGGASAYLTGHDTQKNTFTVGEVTIDLEEPEWDKLPDEDDDGVPDECEDLYATQTVKKDPQVTNTGNNPAWIYLQVEVPCANVITADADGNRLNEGQPTKTQLFTYDINSDWELIGELSTEADKNTYLYATKQTIAPGAKTSTLFDSVTFANIVEGQIPSGTIEEININAYAIQEGNTGSNKEAWNKYSNQATGDAEPSIIIGQVNIE